RPLGRLPACRGATDERYRHTGSRMLRARPASALPLRDAAGDSRLGHLVGYYVPSNSVDEVTEAENCLPVGRDGGRMNYETAGIVEGGATPAKGGSSASQSPRIGNRTSPLAALD